MTVAVTGAAGHVGANLVRELVAAGRPVRALVYQDRQSLEGIKGIEIREVDVLDRASVERALEGAEVVYHLAAHISVGWDDEARVRTVNVEGTRNVVHVCVEKRVRRLVHFSSIHALSPYPVSEVITEERGLSLDPAALAYDRSKAQAEQIIQEAVKTQGLDAVVVNPSGIIGPCDFKISAMGEVLLDLYHRRLPALIEGGFSWVDVRDVVCAAMQAERVGRRGERYLLSGHWLSVADLAALVAEVVGVPAPRFVTPVWLAKLGAPLMAAIARISGRRPLYTSESVQVLQHHRHISHERATRELGYSPRPLRDTLVDTFAWYEQAGKLEDKRVGRAAA